MSLRDDSQMEIDENHQESSSDESATVQHLSQVQVNHQSCLEMQEIKYRHLRHILGEQSCIINIKTKHIGEIQPQMLHSKQAVGHLSSSGQQENVMECDFCNHPFLPVQKEWAIPCRRCACRESW